MYVRTSFYGIITHVYPCSVRPVLKWSNLNYQHDRAVVIRLKSPSYCTSCIYVQ